jgi:hypothetical protein
MGFLLQDHLDSTERYSPASHTTAATSSEYRRDAVHILNEKLEIPFCPGLVERPRLIRKLDRSLNHFAATLVCGRAGTGKTSNAKKGRVVYSGVVRRRLECFRDLPCS